jgi:hypothetical protein
MRTRSGCGMPPSWISASVGQMRLPDQVVALVIERGIEEEAVVLYLEMLVLLTDSALAQRDELLPLRKGAHSNRPFLECNWHRREKPPQPRPEVLLR